MSLHAYSDDPQTCAAMAEPCSPVERLALLDHDDIDSDVAGAITDEESGSMYVVLADAGCSGMLARLAQGDDVGDLNGCQADAFARLIRLAEQMQGKRNKAVSEAIGEEWEDAA